MAVGVALHRLFNLCTVSVYARVIQHMQAWLEEPPILTTVSPVYVKIKIYAKYWSNVISQISSRAGIE